MSLTQVNLIFISSLTSQSPLMFPEVSCLWLHLWVLISPWGFKNTLDFVVLHLFGYASLAIATVFPRFYFYFILRTMGKGWFLKSFSVPIAHHTSAVLVSLPPACYRLLPSCWLWTVDSECTNRTLQSPLISFWLSAHQGRVLKGGTFWNMTPPKK